MIRILVLLLCWPLSVFSSEASGVPEDVSTFMETRDDCDHFRGEEPYDDERRQFLEESMDKLCTGTDKQLADLKEKYKAHAMILDKLSIYEIDIEPN